MSSTVHFTNFRASLTENLLQKLRRLILAAGFDEIDFKHRFVAIKIHFGEAGNLAYLRPQYAKVVADLVKERGGRPFLTDANTLYVGARRNALDHLNCAAENGFSPASTGCQILIADGLRGTDEVEVPIDLEYCRTAKIGRAIMDADIVISLNHFKAHEATGFGGAIKNLGMGSGSRAGKMEMHNDGKPNANPDLCISCGMCARQCAHGAISFHARKARINHDRCVGCGRCVGVCPVDAIRPTGSNSNDLLNYKISEYAYAVVKDRPHFHITLLNAVSPYCDCHAENDMPIIPDVGMFASRDPVAIDQACIDAALAMPVLPGSLLDEQPETAGQDHFTRLHPTTNWRGQIEHGVAIGLGSSDYELIDIG